MSIGKIDVLIFVSRRCIIRLTQRVSKGLVNMYLPFVIIAAAVFMADQACKQLVDKHIPLGQSSDIVPGKLAITHLRNAGAAYGLFSNNRRALLFFTAISTLSIVQTFFDLSQHFKNHKAAWTLFAINVGGAASNIYDRLSKKFVTDYIHVCPQKRTPVFNIADICILVGIVGLLILYLKRFILIKNNS